MHATYLVQKNGQNMREGRRKEGILVIIIEIEDMNVTIKDHFVKGIRLEKSQNARQINFIISEKMIENLLKILLNF